MRVSEAEDLEAWVLMCGEEKGRRGPSQGRERDGGTATATGAVLWERKTGRVLGLEMATV